MLKAGRGYLGGKAAFLHDPADDGAVGHLQKGARFAPAVKTVQLVECDDRDGDMQPFRVFGLNSDDFAFKSRYKARLRTAFELDFDFLADIYGRIVDDHSLFVVEHHLAHTWYAGALLNLDRL